MPRREECFVNNGIYHVFNKTIESKKIFNQSNYSSLFLKLLEYYRSSKLRLGFARLREIPQRMKEEILKLIEIKKYFKIEILCFCLMPTHFHLLIRQLKEGGISKFISDVLNYFTRFYNIQNERKGPIFLPRFKSVKITSDEQLIHSSRYIHLNPYSGNIVKSFHELINYPWSSMKDYVYSYNKSLCSTKFILELFNHKKEHYKQFVLNNANYQKTLEYVKEAEKWL